MSKAAAIIRGVGASRKVPTLSRRQRADYRTFRRAVLHDGGFSCFAIPASGPYWRQIADNVARLKADPGIKFIHGVYPWTYVRLKKARGK